MNAIGKLAEHLRRWINGSAPDRSRKGFSHRTDRHRATRVQTPHGRDLDKLLSDMRMMLAAIEFIERVICDEAASRPSDAEGRFTSV